MGKQKLLKETITAANSIGTDAKLKVRYLICICPIAKATGTCIIDNYVTTLVVMKLILITFNWSGLKKER